jgi:hypothetical protein
MDNGRAVKKILESTPVGKGRMGRPRLRWMEDAGNDLRERVVKR